VTKHRVENIENIDPKKSEKQIVSVIHRNCSTAHLVSSSSLGPKHVADSDAKQLLLVSAIRVAITVSSPTMATVLPMTMTMTMPFPMSVAVVMSMSMFVMTVAVSVAAVTAMAAMAVAMMQARGM